MSSQFSLFNHGIVGESAAIQSLLEHIDVAARCDRSVWLADGRITGEERFK